jgi:hypothetical protein
MDRCSRRSRGVAHNEPEQHGSKGLRRLVASTQRLVATFRVNADRLFWKVARCTNDWPHAVNADRAKPGRGGTATQQQRATLAALTEQPGEPRRRFAELRELISAMTSALVAHRGNESPVALR